MTVGDRIYLLHPHPFPGRWATVLEPGRVRLDNGCPVRVKSRHEYRTEAEEKARIDREHLELQELAAKLDPDDLKLCVEKADLNLTKWQSLLLHECLLRYTIALGKLPRHYCTVDEEVPQRTPCQKCLCPLDDIWAECLDCLQPFCSRCWRHPYEGSELQYCVPCCVRRWGSEGVSGLAEVQGL